MLKNDISPSQVSKMDLNIQRFHTKPSCTENISIKKEYLNEWQQENFNESNISKLCCIYKLKIIIVI